MTQERRDFSPVTRGRTPGRNGGQRIRLLLVDDHTLLRQALRVMLEAQDTLEIVGEATNGRDAVDAAERLRPDVVLMDMVMPGLNGIEATRQIVRHTPGARVLILTAYLEDDRLLEALRAGAAGYVVKKSDLDELLLAIQSVYRGNTYFSADVSAEIAVNEVMMQAKQPEPKAGYELLTGREREVLIGIEAPGTVGVLREELAEQVAGANREAAQNSQGRQLARRLQGLDDPRRPRPTEGDDHTDEPRRRIAR